MGPYPIHYLPFLLKEKNFEVEILTKPYPIPQELAEIAHRKKLTSYLEREQETYQGIKIKRFYGGRWSSLAKLLYYLHQNEYSLIQIHSFGLAEDLGSVLFSHGVPVVLAHHAASLPDMLAISGIRPSVFRNVLRLMDSLGVYFVAFTHHQANLYKKVGLKHVSVIPHAMTLSSFKVPKKRQLVAKYLDEFSILHVGLFEPRKGQEILIRCMPSLLNEHPKTSLILVGKNIESPYRLYLQGLAEGLGIEKHVHFLRASKEELIQLYLHSDLFAFPTTGEIFGHVYLEAMAAGCPVITTDKPVAREILQDGRAGVLVERSVGAFERGILELMGDPELRRRLALNARRAVEQKFELKKILRKWQELYRSLI